MVIFIMPELEEVGSNASLPIILSLSGSKDPIPVKRMKRL
jgi:hypothetical protein